jgi:hypothetical protein
MRRPQWGKPAEDHTMDDLRFDNFARSLAMGYSRRALLRALAGGTLAALATRFGGEDAAAKPPDDTCQPKPGGKCTDTIPCCSGFCDTGHCPCSGGKTLCHGACVQPSKFQTDKHNCGACGHACPKGAKCANGKCVCPEGTTVCDGTCIDLDADHDNCGACGEGCTYVELCSNGVCVCPEGLTHCPNPAEWCYDLDFSDDNCGECGHRCFDADAKNYFGPCVYGICGCIRTGGVCITDQHCCEGHCVGGICQPCRPPGSDCRADLDCCGDGGSGRCIDGRCRCCQYNADNALCNGTLNPHDVICCDNPAGSYDCLNATTGNCLQFCFVTGGTGEMPCPSGYEVGVIYGENTYACLTNH